MSANNGPSSLKIVKGTTKPQRQTHTTVDTIIVTPESIQNWKNPPFQRPLRINDKVRALSEQIKVDGGVIPGVITIGVLERERYLLDGQHRREAFLMSGCQEGFLDVRVHHFESMADMGEEFVQLNSQLVRMRPDDMLRGLEGTSAGLTYIRQTCRFVGYDMIRRNEKSPLVSMSALLRCWFGASAEVPSSSGMSAAARAQALTLDEAKVCCDFMLIAEKAWGRDPEYQRLWGALNLTLCMWLYRRMVITQYSPKTPKLTKDMFTKCLMSLSASSDYIEWLLGRQLSDRDRSPCYMRIKNIFVKRLEIETGKKSMMPSPSWASHSGRHTGGRPAK